MAALINCVDCGRTVRSVKAHLSCILCGRIHSPSKADIHSIIACTPHVAFVCKLCIPIIASQQQRSEFQANVRKSRQPRESTSTQTNLSPFVTCQPDYPAPISTNIYHDASSDKDQVQRDAPQSVSSEQVADIYQAIQQLANEQKRIAKIVENYSFNASTSSSTSISSNNSSVHQTNTSNAESYRSAVSFVPIDTATMDLPTLPQQIEALPAVDSTTLANYIISDKCQLSDDHSDIKVKNCRSAHQRRNTVRHRTRIQESLAQVEILVHRSNLSNRNIV